MGLLDVLLLALKDGAHGTADAGVFEGFFVGFFSCVFSLFGRFEKGVVAAAEVGFEVAPDAVDGSGSGSADVIRLAGVRAVFGLELGGEGAAGLRFLHEEGLGGGVFEMLTDVGEASFPIM